MSRRAGATNIRAVDPAAVAHGAPSLLAVVDRDARLMWCNDAWLRFTGRARAALLGDAWLECLEAADAEPLRVAIADGEAFSADVRIRRHDGRHLWMSASGAPQDDGTTIVSAVDVHATRQAHWGLQLLAAVDHELKRSLALHEILDGVSRILVEELADLCTVATFDDSGRLSRVAIAHRDKDADARLRPLIGEPIDVEGPSAIAQAVRTGTLLYRPLVDAPGPDEPWPPRDGVVPNAGRSLMCTPLHARDGIVGALVLVSWSRRYTPDHVELVQELAHRCAAAIDNATLYRRSEEARARLSLVASVGEHLAAASDVQAVAETLVRRVVPIFADAASVALVDDDRVELRRVAFCHVVPERDAEFRAGPYAMQIPLDGSDPPARAARTGRPVLIEEYARRSVARTRRRPGAFDETARVLDPGSLLAVPLVAHGETLGVLTLGFVGSHRRYSAGDLPLAFDLARRGAVAIERARAFAQERRIAEALQHSMLPETLPDIPGFGLCARYLAGGRADVGGDWYDVVPLSGARHGIAIGDVAGHGVRAAAVMGQLRHALRAFASDGREPAAVIARLNRFVFEQGPLDMATLCYGVLDQTQGRIDIANAGHVPPILMRPGEVGELLDVPPAPPIGADPLSRYVTTTVRLERGTTLFLYTDGLIERRGEPLDAGLARLAQAARLAPSPLDATCDHMIEQLVGDPRPADDVAVLALRFAGTSRGHMRVRRPARAAELSPVRRILSAWLESAGLGAEDIGSIIVAVSEAATNAIEHAYGPGEGWFEVAAHIDDDQAVSLTVRDAGRWRPKARGDGGRGLALIGRLMDEFEVRRQTGGTEVWMRRTPRGER